MHRRRIVLLALAALGILVGGASADDSLEVAHGAADSAPRQPRGVVDVQGRIHLTYGVGGAIVYRRSADGGRSFSQPVELPTAGVISLGMRRGPRIAATSSGVCIAWIAGPLGKGRDGDVVVCRSADDGATWRGPVRVNDAADSAREGLHDLAAGPKGELCCVWLDLRNRKTEIMAATSTDGGAAWTKNVLVYRSPDGSVCECCHPTVAYDAQRAIHVMWRNSLGGNRDMYVTRSTDAGRSFAAATQLGLGHWKLDACPMDGGALAIAADCGVVSVWRRSKQLFATAPSASREEYLADGEQPTIATARDGTYLAWLSRRGGDLLVKGPADREPRVVARQAGDPALFAGRDGGPVCLVWEATEGSRKSIRFRVLAPGAERAEPENR